LEDSCCCDGSEYDEDNALVAEVDEGWGEEVQLIVSCIAVACCLKSAACFEVNCPLASFVLYWLGYKN
jgi:hypothetical protein